MVEQLGLCTFTAEGLASVCGRRTKILQASQQGKKKKKKSQNRREKRGRGKVKAPRHITVAGSEGRRGYHKAGPQWGSGRVEEAVA